VEGERGERIVERKKSVEESVEEKCGGNSVGEKVTFYKIFFFTKKIFFLTYVD